MKPRGHKVKVYHGIEVKNFQMYQLSLAERIPTILAVSYTHLTLPTT